VAKDSRHKYLMGRLLEAILSPSSESRFREVGFQWLAGESPARAAEPASKPATKKKL
jgi:hypothetical protein